MSWRLSGFSAWLVQRISAVYMLLYSVLFGGYFLLRQPFTYQQWHDLFSGNVVAIATLLFFSLMLSHIWVGIRDVIMDYIHPFFIRMVLLVTLMLSLIAMVVWVTVILFAGR